MAKRKNAHLIRTDREAHLKKEIRHQLDEGVECWIRAGELLVELKLISGHGQFEKSVRDIGISIRTARNYMTFFENRDQFTGPNRQHDADLSQREMLRIISQQDQSADPDSNGSDPEPAPTRQPLVQEVERSTAPDDGEEPVDDVDDAEDENQPVLDSDDHDDVDDDEEPEPHIRRRRDKDWEQLKLSELSEEAERIVPGPETDANRVRQIDLIEAKVHEWLAEQDHNRIQGLHDALIEPCDYYPDDSPFFRPLSDVADEFDNRRSPYSIALEQYHHLKAEQKKERQAEKIARDERRRIREAKKAAKAKSPGK